MSDRTPTEHIDPVTSPIEEGKVKVRKRLVLILALLGGLLLLAVIALVIALFARGPVPTSSAFPAKDKARPTAPSTAPSTPKPPAESSSSSSGPAPPAPAPPAPAPPAPATPAAETAITSFTVSPTSVRCNTAAPVKHQQYLTFSWATNHVDAVGFGVATDDALTAGMGWNLAPNGRSDNDFPPGYAEFVFPCPQASESYTLTVSGPGGKFSEKVTVTNEGDR